MENEIESLRSEIAEKDEVIAEAGEMLAMRDRQLAALEERRCEVCGYAEHHREHTGCLRKQIEKLTAERDAALMLQSEANALLIEQARINETMKSALKVARDALNDCEGALDECRDYPITYDTILETLAKINEVLKP